jgi:hypothetical protein
MEQILINLVAGALGGVGVGKSSPTFDLGMIGNIISGLIGGGVLGQIVTLLLPAITAAAQSGNLSVEGIISQVIAGGAGGAILTAIIGAIKNKAEYLHRHQYHLAPEARIASRAPHGEGRLAVRPTDLAARDEGLITLPGARGWGLA